MDYILVEIFKNFATRLKESENLVDVLKEVVKQEQKAYKEMKKRAENAELELVKVKENRLSDEDRKMVLDSIKTLEEHTQYYVPISDVVALNIAITALKGWLS